LVLIDCTTLSTSHERRRDRMAHDERHTSGRTAGAAWDQQALFFLQCIAGFLGEDEVRAKAEELSREE
jgi:hypothetical protein